MYKNLLSHFQGHACAEEPEEEMLIKEPGRDEEGDRYFTSAYQHVWKGLVRLLLPNHRLGITGHMGLCHQ